MLDKLYKRECWANDSILTTSLNPLAHLKKNDRFTCYIGLTLKYAHVK